jgi:hypothetical protein
MARFFGRKSNYLVVNKEIARIFGLLWLGYAVYISIIGFNHWFKNDFSIMHFFIIGSILYPFYLLADYQMKKELSHLNKFAVGLKGEDVVGLELLELSDNFAVYQDVKVSGYGGNIDFVVEGPTGIFVVEVKGHKGKIEFDGHTLCKDGKALEHDFLKQACAEAFKLHEFIQTKTSEYVYINPIIVFSSPFASIRFGKKKVADKAYVINKRWLVDFIKTFKNKEYTHARYEAVLKGLVSP